MPKKQKDTMRQEIRIDLKLNLWVSATLSEDQIKEYVTKQISSALGESWDAMINPLLKIEVKGLVEERNLQDWK